MRTLRFVVLAVSAGALALPARAQDVLTYTELKAKAPVALTRAVLTRSLTLRPLAAIFAFTAATS